MSKMNFEFRKASMEDIDEIFDMIQKIGVEKQEEDIFFFSTNKAEYERLIKNSPCVVAVYKGTIAGSFLTYSEDEDIEGVYETAGERPETTIIFDTCQVLPEYRGNHLETRMAEWLTEAIKGKYKTAICTVHPDNTASVKSLQRAGFKVKKEVKIYGGKRRFIMKKELYQMEAIYDI